MIQLETHPINAIPDKKTFISAAKSKDKIATDVNLSFTSQVSSASPYAYAFVLGGIHESRPAYRGFLYNILVSVSLLREFGKFFVVVTVVTA